jgi:O-acetyl-ADP-ribose deacetylase (regulator of RNase III)
MKIKYVIGDMFESPSLILMHGCNAQGVMGSGVAATMRVRCDFAYQSYLKMHQTWGLKVGDVDIASGVDALTGVNRVIVNAITQEFYGRDPNVVYVSYDSIRAAVAVINYELAEREESMHYEWTFTETQMQEGFPTITLPLIGAGLANGDWGQIAKIIEDESYAFQPLVYVRNEDELKRALQAVELFEASRIKSLSQELASATIDENKALEGTLKDGLNHK